MAPLHPGEGHVDLTDLGEDVEPPHGAGCEAHYAISHEIAGRANLSAALIHRPSETLAADAGTVDDLEYSVLARQGQRFHEYQA